MVEEKRLDRLFYELASEDRIAILKELCLSRLKMQDIARKLDLTATEASRQLQRMSQAKLLERRPEGTYSTTQFGMLLLKLSASMELVYKNDDYFLAHDTTKIPLPFVNRIGELSQAILIADLNLDLARWETLIKSAKEYVWVITPQAMGHLSRVMADKLLEGVKLRSIFREDIRESKASFPSGKNVERKLLPAVPVIMIISEKEASVSFPRLDGNIDYPSFFGTDSIFLKWVNDLYIHYWEQAKIWYSQKA
jgi:predicted transcriptional regulator